MPKELGHLQILTQIKQLVIVVVEWGKRTPLQDSLALGKGTGSSMGM